MYPHCAEHPGTRFLFKKPGSPAFLPSLPLLADSSASSLPENAKPDRAYALPQRLLVNLAHRGQRDGLHLFDYLRDFVRSEVLTTEG